MGQRNAKKKQKPKQGQPVKILKKTPDIPVKINEIALIEETPNRDGGLQGESKVPVYSDIDGDFGNEFYVEINKKLIKVKEQDLIKEFVS